MRDSLGRFLKGAKPENLGRGHFKTGHTINNGKRRSPETEFKKGIIPKNTGLRREFLGKTKDGLHAWVERNLGKPNKCSKCGTTTAKVFEWSNISGEYKPIKDDWQRLCKKCHHRYDFENFGARKEFYKI